MCKGKKPDARCVQSKMPPRGPAGSPENFVRIRVGLELLEMARKGECCQPKREPLAQE